MKPKSRQSPIRFVGPPANLKAEVALPVSAKAQPRIVVDGNELALRTSGDGKTTDSLAFSMPDDTRPRELKGQVILDDVKHSAVITVQPRPMATVDPATIEFKAPAGETATATIEVTNRGNATLKLDADDTVTLREAGTLGRSMASALKQRDRDFADRLIALGEKIEHAPSHDLSVAGRMSPATLRVGAHSRVTLKLGIPKEIDTKTTWSGSIALLGTRVRISVEPTPPNA